MRIGIYDPYLDSLSGGERYMLTAAACLSKYHEVDIFWDDSSIIEKAEVKFGIILKNVKTAPNLFDPKIRLTDRLKKTAKYDRVFILSDGSIPLTLAKKTYLHLQFPVEAVNGRNLQTKLKLKKIKSIVCNSEFTKSFIDKTFGVKSLVLYPPCEQIGNDGKKKNMILTIGRFQRLADGSTFKKHEFLIGVFKKLAKKELQGWEFVVVVSFNKDKESDIKNLEKLCQGYPMKLIKNASHEDLVKFYKSAKIYWHAAGFGVDTRKHPELTEHFGISTVEAMSAGCVPIVINAGGQPEIVNHSKNGFLWKTKEELMEKTISVVRDNGLRENLAVNAVLKANEFSEENFCQNLSKILQ